MEHQSDIVHLVNPDDICLEIKKELSQDSYPFMNNSDKENKRLTNKNHNSMFESYLGAHLNNKSPDCVLYSEDGGEFATFKEILCQTDFLRQILSSTKEHCCSKLEIICPCSEVELGYLVDFLVNGEIQCENLNECLKIQENLHKIFGFPKDLNLIHGQQYRCPRLIPLDTIKSASLEATFENDPYLNYKQQGRYFTKCAKI